VVLGIEDLQMGEQAGAVAAPPGAAAPQVAGLAHPFGVDVGEREVAAAQQAGDLVGIDRVVLGLGAVDEPQGVGVTDDQQNLLGLAQVGQYQQNMHSQPTTRSWRNGAMAARKASGVAALLSSLTILPVLSR